MTIKVETNGTLSARIPTGALLEGVATVGQALTRLALPPDTALIILVNGRLAQWASPLHDGDVLQLLPTVGGG